MEDFACDEVLSGHTPVTKVLETETVLAFHHIKPSWPVHIVVIPKKHIDSLLTLKNGDSHIADLLDVIQRVASMVRKEHGACRIITNLGDYQDTKHLHFHICFGDPLR